MAKLHVRGDCETSGLETRSWERKAVIGLETYTVITNKIQLMPAALLRDCKQTIYLNRNVQYRHSVHILQSKGTVV